MLTFMAYMKKTQQYSKMPHGDRKIELTFKWYLLYRCLKSLHLSQVLGLDHVPMKRLW